MIGIETMIHIHNKILLVYKKRLNNTMCCYVNESGEYILSKVSQRKRNDFSPLLDLKKHNRVMTWPQAPET